ncbi:FAD assembly factor SdhE [Halomonas sp. 328]|uniref:FAD assembly factor SdhE n=1 Tax=Halomonas sp. 328 TaxID=2776704 RepID=UPI0018A6F3EC|nr:succinate dehydrogenase assembly factor 2 [Halomonas sp. 328]
MSEATPLEDVERKRLYWHSRRGMWELDLLLVPFLEQRYGELDGDDRAAYRALLEEEDQDLFVWLMRREPPEAPALRRIVGLIIEHAEHGDRDQFRAL